MSVRNKKKICPIKDYMATYQRLWKQTVKGKCGLVAINREVNKKLCISLYYQIQIMGKYQYVGLWESSQDSIRIRKEELSSSGWQK